MQIPRALTSLPFGRSRQLHFLAEMHEHEISMGNRPIRALRAKYIQRMEAPDEPMSMMIDLGPIINRSWEWHGCLTASVGILNETFKQHLRLEGDTSVIVAPKQIAQNIASRYGVEVNDMMQQWGAVRPYLLTHGIDIPNDLGVATRNLAIEGEANVKGNI